MSARLFVPAPRLAAGRLVVSGEDHHYLFRVLRLRPDDPVTVFDGEGSQASARVMSIEAERAELAVEAPMLAPAPDGSAITVLLPLLKADRSGDCVAKLVELGVTRIVPVVSHRTVVRIEGDRAHSRHQRLLSQARQAARQSHSPFVPTIAPIASWIDAVTAATEALRLAFWERATVPLSDHLPPSRPASIAIAFGPEGGLADDEAEAARRAGFALVSLGARILRAETAPVAVSAILGFAFGDVGRT